MNCRTCIEFLKDYISGALPAGERDVFEEHLRLCPPCVVYLRQYE
jgi:anti-sigma factor RsiW